MTEPLDIELDLFGPRVPSHFYIHVPFCASKCDYCDFASVVCSDLDFVEVVFAALNAQITQWDRAGLEGVVETVYFGGGTPSLYPVHVLGTLEHLQDNLLVHPQAEITVEANPDSLTASAARGFAAQGVTRMSLGVQSFDDHVLRVLGRRHDAKAAAVACRAVLQAGMELSVDLICGIPGQTMTSWSETVNRAVDTGAHHLSIYPLAIEEGTPMAAAVSAGLLPEPDSDLAAEMMLLAEAALGYHGLSRYEVANYAESPRYESRHNLAYWTGHPYAGVGPGAHGMLDVPTARAVGLLADGENDVARVRYGNPAEIEEWLVGRREVVETLTTAETRREDIMLGMRLTRGVAVREVTAAGLDDVLASLERDALVERVQTPRDGARWKTTQRGWLLGNQVFGRIWSGE